MQGRYWIMHPIDGLEGFEGLRQYGGSLALLDNDKLVIQSVTSSFMIAVAATAQDCHYESGDLAVCCSMTGPGFVHETAIAMDVPMWVSHMLTQLYNGWMQRSHGTILGRMLVGSVTDCGCASGCVSCLGMPQFAPGAYFGNRPDCRS